MSKTPLISLAATLISGSIFTISALSTDLLKKSLEFSATKVSDSEKHISPQELEVPALDVNNKSNFLEILEKNGCEIAFPIKTQKQQFHSTRKNIANSVFTKLENKCFSKSKASLKYHSYWGWSVN